MAENTTLWDLPRSVDVAAKAAPERYQRILRLLVEHGPLAMFQVAGEIGVMDHQISGRFTEMKRNLWIDVIRQTRHPRSGCACDVYQITAAGREQIKGR
jgi:predicted ArsR family transcriptional regulator